MRTTRRLGPIALLLALAMIAVACGGGSGDAGDGVASIEDQDAIAAGDLETTDDTETTTAELDTEAAMLAFTQCMRDEGVDIADPEIDADGNLRLGRPEGIQEGTIDPETARAARDACSEYLDGVTQRFQDVDQTELQDQLLAYAECIRDNGYENIDDPDLSAFGPGRGGQPGEGGGGPFGDIDRDDPAFQAADAECRDIFGDTDFGPRLGGGPGRGGNG